MGSVRPWQIGLIVLAVIVLGTSAFFTIRDPNKVEFVDEVYLVDVATGDLFVYNSNKRGIVLPALHPDTGERTLLKVVKTESGDWSLEARDLGRLDEFESINTESINTDTGLIAPPNSKARRITKEDFLKHLSGSEAPN